MFQLPIGTEPSLRVRAALLAVRWRFRRNRCRNGTVVGSFGRIVAKAVGANFSLQRTGNFDRGRGVTLNFTATDPINAFERWRVSAVNTDTRTRRVPAPLVPH